MNDSFLCLNSEWQGCESPILEIGSRKLAKEIFGNSPYEDIEISKTHSLDNRAGVFALETIGHQFVKNLELLQKRAPQRVITIGGSCGVDAAPVAYLNNFYEGDMATVWFDAHGDLNTPTSSPSGHFHGMVLRTLLGEGPEIFCQHIKRFLCHHQVFLGGVRDLDIDEETYIEASNIYTGDADTQLVNAVLDSPFSKVYIHIDVDVINPDNFSDALMPTNGGPTREQISRCISILNQRLDIVGLSIVEYCGKHDDSAKQVAEMLEQAGIRIS